MTGTEHEKRICYLRKTNTFWYSNF